MVNLPMERRGSSYLNRLLYIPHCTIVILKRPMATVQIVSKEVQIPSFQVTKFSLICGLGRVSY